MIEDDEKRVLSSSKREEEEPHQKLSFKKTQSNFLNSRNAALKGGLSARKSQRDSERSTDRPSTSIRIKINDK